MKILLTGGGTAGHVMPNITLIEYFLVLGWDVVYVGSTDGIERDIIGNMKVPYRAIAAGKLRRYFDWRNFTDPLRIIWGFLQSLIICLQERPDVVFSKGGFVTVPLVFAAWVTRIPVIGHESDVSPGLANRMCFPLVKTICVNFPATLRFVDERKAVVTGTPVRESLLRGDRQAGLNALGFSVDSPVLLVFGGSLGAARINQQIWQVLPRLLAGFQVVHVVGSGNVDQALNDLEGYAQREFLHEEFGDVLAAADVVVARAGANSIYELLLTRKPHILIPLSSGASRGDQLDNAQSFADQGYSKVLDEAELTDQAFLDLVDSVYADRTSIISKLETFEAINSVQVITDLIKVAASK